MPNYVQYSPWQEAASMGQGIGNTLGQILLKLPLMKKEIEQRDRALEIDEYNAATARTRSDIYEKNTEAMIDMRESKLAMQQMMDAVRSQLLEAQTQLAGARANDLNVRAEQRPMEFAEKQKMNQVNADYKFGLLDQGERRLDNDTQSMMSRIGVDAVRKSVMQDNAETAREQVRIGAENVGMEPLPRLSPRGTSTPSAEEPPNIGTPPNAENRWLIRNPKTGRYFWSNPEEAKKRGFEVVREFEG